MAQTAWVSVMPDSALLKRNRNILAFILLLAVVLRIAITFFTGKAHMHIDTFDYYKQADALLSGSFINYFPNGYPLLIALLKSISGEWVPTMLLWMNIMMGAGTVFFVYRIAGVFSSNSLVPLLAAFLTAVFPSQINYSRWLLSEVPSVFFLTGFYCCLFEKKNTAAGLLMAAAVLVRTEFIPVFLGTLVLELFFKRKIRWEMAAAFIMPVLAAAYYCYLKTGVFAIAGHSKVNIMYSVTAAGGYIDWDFMTKHPEVQTAEQARTLYMQFAIDNPVQFIKNKLANLWELWGFFPSSSGGNRGLGARLLIGASNFFLLTAGFAGWWRNRTLLAATLLMLPFIVVTGVHTLLLAFPRYTFAAEPFLLIFAADVLVAVLTKKTKSGIS